jgi:hypothetical protein
MTVIRLLTMLVCVGMVAACDGGGDREDMKSPCVGVEGSPCGDRRPVNDWWLA